MRKILIIGSAFAAALLLGSGAFAREQVNVDHSLKLALDSAFVQLAVTDVPFLAPKDERLDAPLMAALREEYDGLSRERMCSQDRTETAMAVPRTVTILLNRATLAYVDPLIDPGNSQASAS